ncbi:MAG: hypothetical protein FJ102_11170 [Deltaproteobacteria bacterium]|nr:hypothetical protein [Deltaproteobacteria bacterium]
MMRLLPASLVLLLAACQPVEPENNLTEVKDTCEQPTASLTEESLTASVGDRITLQGTGKPCTEGAELTPTWTVENVPVESDVDAGSLNIDEVWQPYFECDAVGTYVVSLAVAEDGGGASLPVYAVIDCSSDNDPPVADCGDNQSAKVGDRVDLDGSASRDPEGAELSYEWALSSTPACSGLDAADVYNGSTALASIVPDCDGTYLVSLVVSDGENWSEPSQCAVTVAADNQPPIADAGDSEVLSPCTNEQYQLNGWGSYDPEGEELSYWWTVISAPTGSGADDTAFNDQTAANPYFQWDIVGDYTFQLQVYDGEQWGAPDVVTYTFVDVTENEKPIANAGDDQTITNEPDCETASYVFTCEDCPADSVTVDGSASTDDNGDELDFYWTESTGELTVAAPFSPTTELTTPAFAAEYNTAITKTWTVDLTVSDCADSDTDQVTITYTCTGDYTP